MIDLPAAELIIEDLDVRLTDLTHGFPDDLDIAMVGPGRTRHDGEAGETA